MTGTGAHIHNAGRRPQIRFRGPADRAVRRAWSRSPQPAGARGGAMRRILVPIIVLGALLVPAGRAGGSQPPGRPLPAFVLGGMSFGYLPPGLGTTTDFAYRFQRVDFIARVWESRIPEG